MSDRSESEGIEKAIIIRSPLSIVEKAGFFAVENQHESNHPVDMFHIFRFCPFPGDFGRLGAVLLDWRQYHFGTALKPQETSVMPCHASVTRRHQGLTN